MSVEVLLVVTVISSREVGCGGTPRIWVDGVAIALDFGWDKKRCSRPEPNLDTILLATGEGVKSTPDFVETLAIGIRTKSLSSTTLVEVEIGVTVGRDGLSVGAPVSN